MRELKGDWKDLFNGFMLALDLRKMFLGFCGIMFTLFGPLAATCWVANQYAADYVTRPQTFALHDIWATIRQAFTVIYCGVPGYPTSWTLWLPHLLAMAVTILAIWAYFGGAISRIAAYEIAKDGERIETARALQFARRKFWAFFMSPWVCVIGLAFFFLCNFLGGVVGRVLDFIWVGGPLVALFLPLALLSGFVMTLIGLGTVAGLPLFAPAVAAEGTDAFDAMSRGFSYVYSRPWHYLFYQAVAGLYGAVCVSFVILFAVTMCHAGLTAGAAGFDLFGVHEAPKPPPPPEPPKAPATPAETKAYLSKRSQYLVQLQNDPDKYAPRHDRFRHIADTAWAMILTDEFESRKSRPKDPIGCAYARLMNASNCIVKPDHSMTIHKLESPGHRFAASMVLMWLVIALGLALGYIPSYFLSQQTLIYCLLRKRVDGIEMNEVFEETEDEPLPAEPPKGPEPTGPAKGAGDTRADPTPPPKG
ncbi:MAG TPA: hypothetical protein VGK61_08075 [Planctomycetota bacterium]